ncbi:MAG: hypothetical protein KC517_05690 [Bacteroidetes bacterium]|nr:hypothetical protein [Bacteroidota bacterium]
MIQKKYIVVIALTLCSTITLAQGKKVWASGAARSVFQQNKLNSAGDTITPTNLNSGNTLVDVALNARPNANTFVHAMVRVRNDFGGFWGSGVTFDMRQMYLKGLVNDAVRYQLGDINYKLSPYTFFNNQEELSSHQSEVLNIYRDMVHYDLFYTDDNTWRQQGAAVDFTLEFSKAVKELQVNSFMFRNRPTDFGQSSERIFFGGNATLLQSDKLAVGLNYVDMMDVLGTSRSEMAFHNPVITGTTEIHQKVNAYDLSFTSESGISEMYTLNDPNAKGLRDYFYDLDLKITRGDKLPSLSVNYINVGPQFRSVGAQSRRINFESQAQMFNRYGNDQVVRPVTQLDMMQDASLYQPTLSMELQRFAPQYDNVQPYGKATPNRKGLSVNAIHSTNNELINVDATYRMLSEVVGQGTDELRTFNVIDLSALIRLDTLMPTFKHPLEVSLGITNQNTQRDIALDTADVDFTSTMVDLGVKVGLSKDFAIIGSYRMINAKGLEFLNTRNDYSEIVDFERFNTEMNQSIMSVALRYTFDEKNHLNIVWQKLNYEDAANSETPAFDLSQFGIVYSMYF